ncbi:class I SAM-dependent methyltransferase [Gammaproteobacteria bacterium]|nr:class I SAM-dependent methyltransferase [Gammaproteobacteria bacterium]
MEHPTDQNNLESQKEYFDHLHTITLKGRIYRSYYLYPRINNIFSGKALDIGCGLGDFASHRPGTVAIDINPFCVKYCKDLGIEAYHTEEPPFPFENESFDSIFLDNVLEHIEEPDNILNEIYRLLKPEGIFIIGVPGLQGFRSQADHRVYYDEESLPKKLLEYNFFMKKHFFTPFKSEYLNENLNAYCLYAVFEKKA